MGPRAGLDGCVKSRLCWDSIPGPSSPYPVPIPTELPGFESQVCTFTVQTDIEREHSVLPLVLPIQICLLLVCPQVACALQGCSKCQSKKRAVQYLITSSQRCYK